MSKTVDDYLAMLDKVQEQIEKGEISDDQAKRILQAHQAAAKHLTNYVTVGRQNHTMNQVAKAYFPKASKQKKGTSASAQD